MAVKAAPVVGDELERHYTPLALARAIVLALPGECDPQIIVEPSVGDGAFVVACRERWPDAKIIGCDVDPNASGLRLCDMGVLADWETEAEHTPKADLIIGNPPFSHAIPHLLATRENHPDAWVSWILPWAYPGVGEWSPVLEDHPLWHLQPIKGRPWPKNMRETGNYVWGPEAREGGTRLILPSVEWQGLTLT